MNANMVQTKHVKVAFELEIDDEYYQHILTQIKKLGYHYLPVHKGIRLTKIEERGAIMAMELLEDIRDYDD